MHDPAPTNTLSALSVALEAAGATIQLVRRVPAPLRSVADQAIRAAASVPANLSEGAGRSGRDRFNHWRMAYASAKEIDVHLRLLVAAEAISPEQAETAIDLFDRARAMTWRLIHPRVRDRVR